MDTILGINTQVFIDNGIWGIITLGLILVGKFWVIPSISKFLENRVSMGTQVLEKLDAIINTMSESSKYQVEITQKFREDINEAHKDRKVIDRKIDVLLGEHVGTLDDNLALNIFASTMDKQHLVAISFYNLRVYSNGLETNRTTIMARYMRKAEEIAGKTINQLGHYYHDGQKLSAFIESYSMIYFRQVMTSLFNAQESIYEETDSISLEDIEAALDRNVSRLITAYRKWLSDKSYTCELASKEVNFDMWQETNDIDIEML